MVRYLGTGMTLTVPASCHSQFTLAHSLNSCECRPSCPSTQLSAEDYCIAFVFLAIANVTGIVVKVGVVFIIGVVCGSINLI